MTIKPLKIVAKIIFISRKTNLNIQNLEIIPYNQKKNANLTWCVIFAVQYINIALQVQGVRVCQSLNRLLIWNLQNCRMFPLAFVAGWLQGHWWGFISRNNVVWPIFFLMNVFIALKGSHFWFLFSQMDAVKKYTNCWQASLSLT